MIQKVLDLNNLSIDNVKLFNSINEEIKYDYHKLIEQIYNQADNSIDWLLNSLLSRNNYLSSVFINLCYLELLKRIVVKEDISIVIVKTPALKKVIVRYFKDINKSILVKHSESIWVSTKKRFSPYYHFVLNLFSSLQMYLSCNRKRRVKTCEKEIILIDIFITKNTIIDGRYTERYYNGLLDELDDEIKSIIFFVPTILLTKSIRKFVLMTKNLQQNFLFKFDYLRFADYWFALTSPYRIKKIDLKQFEFRDCKIGHILEADFCLNIANPSSVFIGLLDYLFFKRLKASGLKLKLVVDWFENQVLDRGFNKGKNEFYPDVKSIGYEGFVVSYDYNFYLQPSLAECNAGTLPNIIAVHGIGLVDEIKRYHPNIPVITAPAFRFKEMYEHDLNYKIVQNDVLTILAALPISPEQSKDILLLLNEFIKVGKNLSFRILIKPHPELNMNKLYSSFFLWPPEFNQIEGSFNNILSEADIVVSNTSSTCLEALAYGIPVIIIGSRCGLTQNPIPKSIPKTIWDICYEVDEFSTAIKRLCIDGFEKKGKEYMEIAKNIRKEYFEPVTMKGVMDFLGLNDYKEGGNHA